MIKERDRLIQKIETLMRFTSAPPAHEIADFILADRQRIVEPLVNIHFDHNNPSETLEELQTAAIKQTLKLAGVQDG